MRFCAKSQEVQYPQGFALSKLEPLGFPWTAFFICTQGGKDSFSLPVFLMARSLVGVNPFMSILKSFTLHLFMKFIQIHC